MSIRYVENEIRRTLATAEAEVLCISGDWGVGKTYTWNQYFKQAQAEKAVALKYYAYVSLFGITSLDELKYSIFENTVKTSVIGVKPSLETLKTQTIEVTKRFGKTALPLLQQLPYVKNLVGGVATALSFMAVSETIICIDDIERRGEKLSIQDVFGLVSNLVEQRRCKIVLIMNDNAEDTEKKKFKKYSEKVIDKHLRFAPTSLECVRIALSGDTEADRYLRQCCTTLGISNIRVLKKIERFVRAIESLMKDLNEQVLKQAIQTITLMGWCVYEPDNTPTIEFLKDRQRLKISSHAFGKQTMTESDAAWNALLDNYKFTNVDKFDEALLDGVKNGYFDREVVLPVAQEMDNRIKTSRSFATFASAWEIFHDSFDDNGEEVVQRIYESYIGNADVIDVGNMNSVVVLLKEMGKLKEAEEVINYYLTRKGHDKDRLDLEYSLFGNHAIDTDVRSAFVKKLKSFRDERNPTEILLSMSKGCNPEDIVSLYSMDVDDYYKLFKTTTGQDQRTILANCLRFSRTGSSSDQEKEIVRRAREALTRIGEESLINSIRVRNYGISIDKFNPGKKPYDELQHEV